MNQTNFLITLGDKQTFFNFIDSHQIITKIRIGTLNLSSGVPHTQKRENKNVLLGPRNNFGGK